MGPYARMLADTGACADRADMGAAVNAVLSNARTARGQRADMRTSADAMGTDMSANTDAQHINTNANGVRAGDHQGLGHQSQRKGRNQKFLHDRLLLH
jgi:hypothetical protein